MIHSTCIVWEQLSNGGYHCAFEVFVVIDACPELCVETVMNNVPDLKPFWLKAEKVL